MAVGILGPFNGVINKTVKEILDSEISSKVTKVFTTFVSSSLDAADSAARSLLEKVLDLTKEDPPSAGSS